MQKIRINNSNQSRRKGKFIYEIDVKQVYIKEETIEEAVCDCRFKLQSNCKVADVSLQNLFGKKNAKRNIAN